MGILVNNINIECKKNKIKPFMKEFYAKCFKNVYYNNNMNNYINLGVILGSIEGLETRKRYLSKSLKYSKGIPDSLYENARFVSQTNK